MRYHEAVAQALAETIVPRGGPFALGGADVPIAQRLESMTVRLGYPFGILRILIILLDFLPILLLMGCSRLMRMSPESREAFVARLASSRWLIHQALFYAIKAWVVTIFYSDPDAGRSIGYPEKIPPFPPLAKGGEGGFGANR